MEKVIIFGAGKIGKSVLENIGDKTTIIEVWDNGKYDTEVCGYNVKKPHSYEELAEKPDKIIIAIGQLYKQACINQCIELDVPMEKIETYTYFEKKALLKKYGDSEDEEIIKYVNYLKENDLSMINEEFVESYKDIDIQILKDTAVNLFYVLHNNKKLYFKRSFSEKQCENYYRSILVEQDIRSPHHYLDNEFNLFDEKNIVLDCGAAEGFFGVDNIEKIEKLIVVECNNEWLEALKYTFECYGDKVIIVGKMISDCDAANSVTVDTLCEQYHINFIKMDIEGAEKLALNGMRKYLEDDRNNKCVICTYHKSEDAKDFEKMFSDNGYKCNFTKGFLYIPKSAEEGMVTSELEFRRAVLQVSKNTV